MRNATALLPLVVGLSLAAALPAAAGDCCDPNQAPPVAASKGNLSRVAFQDQRGAVTRMPDGRVWVVALFYGSCETVCPKIVYNVGQVAKRMPPALADKVAFGAITFDPGRDSLARIQEVAKGHGFTAANQYVLRGDEASTAAAVKATGFSYQPDGQGGFRHVNLLAVIDGGGHVKRHFYGLDPDLDRVVAAVEDLAR